MRRVSKLLAAVAVMAAACGSGTQVDRSPDDAAVSPDTPASSPSDGSGSDDAADDGTGEGGTSVDGGRSVPWSADPLARDEVPPVLVDEWAASENRETCSALFPADVDALADDARARPAAFGGGWSLAWDLPDGPGRDAAGEYCEDCGRGAFGVAGTGVAASPDEPRRWPTVIEYADGSLAGYGIEGDQPAGSGAPHLAYVAVYGEGCLYNVWSFLGAGHLEDLLGQLRYVEGLRGEPTPWSTGPDTPGLSDLGAAPWLEAPLDPGPLPDAYFEEWVGEAGAPDSCPLMAFADLGEEANGATIRRAANAGEMLVAWDRPDGPGHGPDSEPCEDCGRGVIGLGTFESTSLPAPRTHRWSDGSTALIEEGLYGTEARVAVEGTSCTYWVWSHLGEDHLLFLLSQLRRVEGYP